MKPAARRAFALLTLFAFTGCDLAPEYKPPHFLLPASWKGTRPFAVARPLDAQPKGEWWRIFHDPVLDRLEQQATRSNPDLQAAAERLVQARDMMKEAESGLYPHVGLSAGGGRYGRSRHKLWRSSTSRASTANNVQYEGAARWEPDFWSSIRNRARLEKYEAQAQAAAYTNARLSLQADLASHYMQLRGLDEQDLIYSQSIKYYEAAVSITRMRQLGAISAGLDVSRAQNQLAATRAQQTEVRAQRELVEHAIAVMVNVAPSSFHIAPVRTVRHEPVPELPAGFPSQLLERRPDIAQAEREMAAANRMIGISRAAFYPHVVISATGGFQDKGFDLASLANSMWSAAVAGALPLFEGGLRRAELQRSWSRYRETRDHYRSVVLSAFQEVEDALSLVRHLGVELKQQNDAVSAALRTQGMSMTLYTGGLSNYLDVVVAQEAALVARIAAAKVRARQKQAVVGLVRALGGGWKRADLPHTAQQLSPFGAFQYENLRVPKATGVDGPLGTPADNDLRGLDKNS